MSAYRMTCTGCQQPGVPVYIDHRGVERYGEHLIAPCFTFKACPTGHEPTGRDTARCKHCDEWLVNLAGPGEPPQFVHATGDQRGKTRCALNPYGFQAEPAGAPCGAPCRGKA